MSVSAETPAGFEDPRLPVAGPEPMAQAALAAQEAGDWATAIGIWETVRAHFPDYLPAYENAIHGLGAAGRSADRDALFGLAAQRFPGVE